MVGLKIRNSMYYEHRNTHRALFQNTRTRTNLEKLISQICPTKVQSRALPHPAAVQTVEPPRSSAYKMSRFNLICYIKQQTNCNAKVVSAANGVKLLTAFGDH